MWLSLARIPADQLAAVRADPALVESIFSGEDPWVPGFDPVGDVFGTRYDDLYGMITAVVEGIPGPAIVEMDGHQVYRTSKEPDFDLEDSWVAKATGAGIGETVAYEFTYGEAFVLTAAQVKEVAAGLAIEPLAVELAGVDDDRNIPGLIRFYAAAAAQGKAIVGGVS